MMESFAIGNIPLLRFSHFPDDRLTHFCTTVRGGISCGNYCSFNLGEYCGDDSANVAENRLRLAKALQADTGNIIVPNQTHNDNILSVDDGFLSSVKEVQKRLLNNVDALMTNKKGVFIGVTTADCVPVLIYDPVKKAIASIHAGWKGTAKRIASKTVKRMASEYGSNPHDLIVGIAPSISPEKFEVGDEVGEIFHREGFALPGISYRNAPNGKLFIDLWEANYIQLLETSVLPENIAISGLCTYSRDDLFFSARRQGILSGRMLTGGILY